MSAEALLAALYPPSGRQIWNEDIAWQPIPVHTVPKDMDKVKYTVHPIYHAHYPCFIGFCCSPILYRATPLPLGQSYDCLSASAATLKNRGNLTTWIESANGHWYDHSETKTNKTMGNVYGTYYFTHRFSHRYDSLKILFIRVRFKLNGINHISKVVPRA